MCGIFGVFGKHKKELLKSSDEEIRGRGKDEFLSLETNGYYLSQSRLAITDIDTPLRIDFGDIDILFNGEIYNYKEILAEFKEFGGEREAILLSYRHLGVMFAKKLKGMFAIALFDKTKNRVILARDRFGKKPLYFSRTASSFIFSSRISAILPHLGKKSMNKQALLDYLSLLAPTEDRTMYEGVSKVEASCVCVYEEGHFSSTRYYNPLSKDIDMKEDEAICFAEELLDKSIRTRESKESKSAIFLSGGIDSGLLASFLKLPSFTLGYEGYEKYDESKNAAQIASILNIENQKITFSKSSFLELIDDLPKVLDEPINDPAALPLMYMCQEVQKNGYKVAFSGDGGDELFLGYAFYAKIKEFELLEDLPFKAWLKNYISSNPAQNREWEWYKRALDGGFVYRNNAECFSDLQLVQLLKMQVQKNQTQKSLSKLYRVFGESKDGLKWAQFADIYHHLAEVLLSKADRVGMLQGVEIRSPFMDERLVEFGLNLSGCVKLKDGITKPLLREMFTKRVDKTIAYNKKKGFSYPFLEWLEESGELAVIDRVNKKANFFHQGALDFLKKQSKKGNLKRQIFGLYLFCKWWEREF